MINYHSGPQTDHNGPLQ